MSWQHWAILAMYAFSIGYTPFMVGKPRDSLSVEGAMVQMVLGLLFVVLLVTGQ